MQDRQEPAKQGTVIVLGGALAEASRITETGFDMISDANTGLEEI